MLPQILLTLLLTTLSAAVPTNEISASGHGDAWQYGTSGGIVGLIVLILDIFVFAEVFKSNRPPSSKILWCLVVFFFPVLGMIIYWLFSNRAAHNRGAGYEALT